MTSGVEHPLIKLADRWRERAATLSTYGADSSAKALQACSVELEAELRSWLEESLTLEEAAAESGYSYSSLQKRVAGSEILNAGDKGSPRIRRRDLPYKPTAERVDGIAAEALLRRL